MRPVSIGAKTSSGGWTAPGCSTSSIPRSTTSIGFAECRRFNSRAPTTRRTLDLNSLTDVGVKILGRIAGINEGKAQFSGSLRNLCEMADLKMNRLLDRIDEWATENGLDDEVAPPHRLQPTRVEASLRLGLDLNSGEFQTIVWATGFRPDHSWIEMPIFDRKGRIRHDGGVVEAAGMYLMGIPFLRRRKSSLIDGAGDDARDLSAHLAGYLDGESPLPVSEDTASAVG